MAGTVVRKRRRDPRRFPGLFFLHVLLIVLLLAVATSAAAVRSVSGQAKGRPAGVTLPGDRRGTIASEASLGPLSGPPSRPVPLDDDLKAKGYPVPGDANVYAVRVLEGPEGRVYEQFEAGGGALAGDFWPASSIKVLAALGALDFARSLGFTGAATVAFDDGLASQTLRSIYEPAIRDSSNYDYDLLVRIDKCLREGARHIIIDLSRVHDVDTTGAQMLIQIRERVQARGGTLIVSHAAPGQPQWDFLVDTGVVASLGKASFTPDTDRALEIAENRLLEAEGGDPSMRAEIPLRALNFFARLTTDELAVLAPLITRRAFDPGEFIFREGDPGEELFVIARGTASVYRVDGERSTRLITFGEGTLFGEMALLDAKPRSASVQADNAMACYVMSRAVFDELVLRHDAIALKLLTSLSQELGRRVRFANEIIDHLQA